MTEFKAEIAKKMEEIGTLLNLQTTVGASAQERNGNKLPERAARTDKRHPLNSILYGAPGTGKTYSSVAYALAVIDEKPVDLSERTEEQRKAEMERFHSYLDKGRIVFTTFHQNYGYEDFIQGLRPDIAAEGFSFRNVDGVFKAIADRAMYDMENNYVMIIDEINRANISKVFGELITLIEDDKRWGEINGMSAALPSGELFAVPNNLYLIGTMNSSDKSISLIDAALRRRFEFVELAPRAEFIKDAALRRFFVTLNERLADELNSTDLLIGHSFFINREKKDLADILNRSIIPLLYEYFYDNKKKIYNILKEVLRGTDLEVTDEKMRRLSVRNTEAGTVNEPELL